MGTRSRAPADLLALLVGQTLRHGLVGRRLPAAWSLASRHAPVGLLPSAVAALPRRPHPQLDALLVDVAAAWPRLVECDPRLPAVPAELDALALVRRSSTTVFVICGADPVLVVKLPRGDTAVADREARLLERVRELDVAPRPLGRIGRGFAQSMLEGTPLEPPPIVPAHAGALAWPAALARLGDRLAALAGHTAAPGPLDLGVDASIERAIHDAPLSVRARAALAGARRDLRRLAVTVVAHADLSPQNVLCSDGMPRGLIDWEHGSEAAPAGFDLLNAVVAYLDVGVARARWSRERAVETFTAAWAGPYGAGARRALHTATAGAGLPASAAGAVQAGYFGCVLGVRLTERSPFGKGPDELTRIVELVCGDAAG